MATPIPRRLSDQDRAAALVFISNDLGGQWIAVDPSETTLGTTVTSIGQDYLTFLTPCGVKSRSADQTAVARGDTFNLLYGTNASLIQSNIFSGAFLYKTADKAKADLDAAFSPSVLSCANRLLANLTRSTPIPGFSFSILFRRVPMNRYADESAAIQLTGQLTFGGLTKKFFLKVAAIRKGRALTDLILEDVGEAFPASLEQQLEGRLAARLVADGGR